MNRILLIAAIAGIVLASCKKDEVTLQSIAVTTQPTKTTYTVGETLNLSGMVVTASYSDKTTKAVTGYTTAPANNAALNTAGAQTVTVTYTENEKTATTTLTVTVEAKAVVPDPNIKVENEAALEQTVFADETDGKSEVKIVTTGAWTSTIAEGTAKSAVSWISISPDRGNAAGSYTITINLEPNATGEERTATITITCNGNDITITVTQKATKENGEPYIAFVAVTDITGVATTATAGTPLTLTGTVVPTEATNKTIVWSVENAGTTNATIVAGVLNVPNAGTVKVRATIVNGATATTNYTQDFNITVTEASPGTSGNPFKVGSLADLQKVGSETDGWTLSAHYEQTSNIDLADITWSPIGANTRRFTGSYNGGGFSISNLTVFPVGNQGLFGYIGAGGVVKNIALLDVDIIALSWSGGVASYNFGTIQNCYVTGSIVCNGGASVGGLVGVNEGRIENCYTTCNVSGSGSVGGVVGSNSGGTVKYSYATGYVTATGSRWVGGIVGYASSSADIRNCVALNKEINGPSGVGRVVGEYTSAT